MLLPGLPFWKIDWASPAIPQTLPWKILQTARNPFCEASNKIEQISYHQGKELSFKSHTAQKTNMDTQNDSLEKVIPFKYGHFWYLC